MAERNSEYERKAGDCYFTPQWVYDALFAVEEFVQPWDCAPRNADFDFLAVTAMTGADIVTNPPYSLAPTFCRHALELTEPFSRKVAMLLPMAFDCAKGRVDLFRDHPAFKRKLVLTRRIRWENLEQSKAGPSMNHAWFVWDWKHFGPPTISWLDGGKG
jgi:hypothetical protein